MASCPWWKIRTAHQPKAARLASDSLACTFETDSVLFRLKSRYRLERYAVFLGIYKSCAACSARQLKPGLPTTRSVRQDGSQSQWWWFVLLFLFPPPLAPSLQVPAPYSRPQPHALHDSHHILCSDRLPCLLVLTVETRSSQVRSLW